MLSNFFRRFSITSKEEYARLTGYKEGKEKEYLNYTFKEGLIVFFVLLHIIPALGFFLFVFWGFLFSKIAAIFN